MKVKKIHRRKKFHAHYNRKRMRNKQTSTGAIMCKPLKEAWNSRKSTQRNMAEMGLAMDPNKAVPIPNHKKIKIEEAVSNLKEIDPKTKTKVDQQTPSKIVKKEVVKQLEIEARAPREKRFMLPKGQVEFITYLLDKYGHDYKAMAKDRKNYYQETWKQLRAKVKTFIGIPKQYSQYLAERGLLESETDEKTLKDQAEALVMDDSE